MFYLDFSCLDYYQVGLAYDRTAPYTRGRRFSIGTRQFGRESEARRSAPGRGLRSVRQTDSPFGFLCVRLGLMLCFVAFTEDLSWSYLVFPEALDILYVCAGLQCGFSILIGDSVWDTGVELYHVLAGFLCSLKLGESPILSDDFVHSLEVKAF